MQIVTIDLMNGNKIDVATDQADQLRHFLKDVGQIYDFLDHIEYLEHSDKEWKPCRKQPRGGYWPQSASEDRVGTEIEDYCGLDLLDYIKEVAK